MIGAVGDQHAPKRRADMRAWLVITAAAACALTGSAYAKQSGTLARSNDASGQAEVSLTPNPFAPTNSRPPAAISLPSHDVVAGTTFVGRDPDRHIRFQILRDSKF
jgi:hypothetical protein